MPVFSLRVPPFCCATVKQFSVYNCFHVRSIYNDIIFLTKKSKQYVYDLAKGTHVLMYQRTIEGIALTLTEAGKKFNDHDVFLNVNGKPISSRSTHSV